MNSYPNSNNQSPLDTGLLSQSLIMGDSSKLETQPMSIMSRSSLGGGDGLKAEYYDNRDLTNLKLTRIDPTVNFFWENRSPDATIAPDTFSVRWTGQVQALYNETYTFSTTTDDGVRLWVNNQLLIDRFINQASREWTGRINLQAGQRYDIRMEYYENTGGATAQLSWSSTSQRKEIIPQSQLFSEVLLPAGPPISRLNATDINIGSGDTYTFTVTYSDNTGVDFETLDSNDLLVTGPNGFSQLATLVSVDNSTDGTPRTASYRISAPTGTWTALDNGTYTIALQANQVSDIEGNFATAGTLGTFRTAIAGSGMGLTGQYYDNIDFTNLRLTRVDPTVNFNWVNGSPDPSIGVDTFSVVWTGQVEPLYSETYTFFTTTDDGVRLSINGTRVIDRLRDQSPTEVTSTPVNLVAGQRYDIRLEYYENLAQASSSLAWSSTSQRKEIIARSQLYNNSSTPTATLNANNVDVTNAGNSYTFSVTYNDNTAIDISSLDNQDISVTGPNNFSQLATLVSVDNSNNGTPRTATYRITAPSGVWDASDAGTYNIVLQANQVRDTEGNFVNATTLGSFRANIGRGNGTGLRGEYYDNINFTNLKLTRTDATVNFDWRTGSPDPSIAADTFSVIWTGQVQPLYNETYTFFTTTDDGVRLTVNGQQIINRLVDQSAIEIVSAPIILEAGRKYDIRLEYYENAVDATARLAWSSASQVKEIIPQSQLYSPPLLPTINLGNIPTSVSEADGSVTVTIERRGEDLSMRSSVKYNTTRETATPEADYTETSGTLVFEAGETTKTINIPILQDILQEETETFTFVVDQPQDANLGVPRTARIEIDDDDRTDLFFSNLIVNENNGTATLNIRRGNATNAASVDFMTQNGTATAGSDYQALSGRIDFAVGERSKNISISLIDNTIGEANEDFIVTFSNAVGVDLTQNTARITIIDNDPGNFTRETVVSGLIDPTAFEWSPDNQRLYIAQKDGRVRVFENGNLLAQDFIDISAQVNNVRDRGLLGIAVHPDFANNPYVYLLFTYDPPEVYNSGNVNNPNTLAGSDEQGNRPSRLIRVTADAATGFRTAIAGSEVVLLGKNSTWENTSRPDANSTGNFSIAPSGIVNSDTGRLFASAEEYLANLNKVSNIQDYLATDSESHSIGDLEFVTNPDGSYSLFVSNGDGASYNQVDQRIIRAQDVNNLSGKVLRINPITGQGYTDNPFYNGDINSNASKVYNYGLRNPFRMAINPNTNMPVIGDVGWKTWEEINTGRAVNFGWPYYEGGDGISIQQPEYAVLPEARDFYNSNQTVTAPIYAYRHTSGSNAILMGDYYTANVFPSIYQGSLFIGDIATGTIDSLTLDNQGRFQSIRRFDTLSGRNVQFSVGADGFLYYANLDRDEIGRWRPTNA